MSANPSDIAKYTSDGVVLTAWSATVRDSHPESEDLGESIIDTFFVNAADAQILLDERFSILSRLNGLHEAVVVEDSLGIGTQIPIQPSTPCFNVVDDTRQIDTVLRTRAYAFEAGSDQFSIELLE